MRQRVGIPYAIAIAERLTPRDWAILSTLHRCRLATGRQLERLHFAHHAPRSRTPKRSRVLSRLVRYRVITVADRPYPGPGGGRPSPLYLLDTAGATLLQIRTDPKHAGGRAIRRPGLPGDRFVAHMLAVTELYVQAVEADRAGRFTLSAFAAEPASWWIAKDGTTLKPDAFLRATYGDVTDRWWIEVDRGTESLPTVAAKLRAYTRFATTDGHGPAGVLPAILITTPGSARADAIRTRALPPPDTPGSQADDVLPESGDGTKPADLFHVVAFRDAIDTIATILQN